MKYEIKRGSTIVLNHEINGKRTRSAPAVDFIDIDFTYPEAIHFERNDTIVFKGQTYYCDKQFNYCAKNSKHNYNHKARFLSENYRATDIVLLDPNGKPKFEIEGDLTTLLTLAVSNLNRVSSGWSFVPPSAVTPIETFDIDGENVMSFLVKVAGTYEKPFDIKNKVINFNTPVLPITKSMAYGKGKGFLDLKLSYNNSIKIANTVYGIGGDGIELDNPVKNQTHINANGIIEGIYTNSDIIPTTRATTYQVYFNSIVTSKTFNFDLNPYIINGELPVINFENGALGGLSFYINYFGYTPDGTITTIFFKERLIDGIITPNDNLKPSPNDNFNITGIKQPDEAVQNAKNKLLAEATKYLNDNIRRSLKIDVSIDPLYNIEIGLNSRIGVLDSDLNINDTFIVNEIRESLQDLEKKEVVLEYNSKFIFRYALDRVSANILDLSIQNNFELLESISTDLGIVRDQVVQIDTVKLPLLDTEVLRAYDRGDSAFLKAENIELVELPPIRQEASNALTLAGTADGNATNALSGVSTLTPKVATLETDIVKKATIESVTAVDSKATNANTNANNAIRQVRVLTPKVADLEAKTDTITPAKNGLIFNEDVIFEGELIDSQSEMSGQTASVNSNFEGSLVFRKGIFMGVQ